MSNVEHTNRPLSLDDLEGARVKMELQAGQPEIYILGAQQYDRIAAWLAEPYHVSKSRGWKYRFKPWHRWLRTLHWRWYVSMNDHPPRGHLVRHRHTVTRRGAIRWAKAMMRE